MCYFEGKFVETKFAKWINRGLRVSARVKSAKIIRRNRPKMTTNEIWPHYIWMNHIFLGEKIIHTVQQIRKQCTYSLGTIRTALIKQQQQQWLQGILQTSPTESCPQNFAVNGECPYLDVWGTPDFPCSRAYFPVIPRLGTPARWETTVCPWGYCTSCFGRTVCTSPRKHEGGSGREKS